MEVEEEEEKGISILLSPSPSKGEWNGRSGLHQKKKKKKWGKGFWSDSRRGKDIFFFLGGGRRNGDKSLLSSVQDITKRNWRSVLMSAPFFCH